MTPMDGHAREPISADCDLSEERLRAANINPRTRLATDYLNHFNEVIMLLELMPSMPEVAADVLAWRPRSYVEHFAASKFREKDLALAAWMTADPNVRASLLSIVAELDASIGEAQDLVRGVAVASPEFAEMSALLISIRLRPLIDQASSLINGVRAPDPSADHWPQPTAQDSVDELFS